MVWVAGLVAVSVAGLIIWRLITASKVKDADPIVPDTEPASPPARLDRIRDRALSAPSELTEESLSFPKFAAQPDERTLSGVQTRDEVFLPRGITEGISVVLRKQIPPLAGPPRSWLGGLPMLPDGVEWPRGINPEKKEAGEVPLHFIAQIACADLPADLWGGLGPRHGWLLLFVNGNTCMADDPGAWRVLHFAELGEVRHPPEDIGPIHDGMYTGSTPSTLREVVYPRWPVDLICVENQLRIDGQRTLTAPENFASILYDGAPVANERDTYRDVDPFSWRCVANALDRAIDQMTTPNPNAARYAQQMQAKLSEPGQIEDIVPALERREATFWSGVGAVLNEPEPEDIDPAEKTRRNNMRSYAAARRDHIDAVRQLLREHPTPESLLHRLEREGQDEWRHDSLAHLTKLRATLQSDQLDTPLSADQWSDFQRTIGAFDKETWSLAWGRTEGAKLPVTVERRKLSLIDYLKSPLASESRLVARQYYLDPNLRTLIPTDEVEALEASLRMLHENRPHRMGGYHDGLQSDAQPGPASMLLLMQFAVDEALEWVWGDNGAVYCFIAPQDLASCAFDRAAFHLECH